MIMEELFELLAGTNGMVTIEVDNFIRIDGEIASTEKFNDGLKLYFEDYSEYFLSSVYNTVIDKFVMNGNAIYHLQDSIHNMIVTVYVDE